LIREWLRKVWRVFFKTQVTIELIRPNFRTVEKKHNPPPFNLNGYEVEKTSVKVLEMGSNKASRGATFPPEFAGQISLGRLTERRTVTEKTGEVHIVFSKPKQEEAAK